MTAARWTNGILGLWLAVALSVAATPLAGQAPAVGTVQMRVAVGGVGPGGLSVLEGSPLTTIARIEGLEQVHGSAIAADGRIAYAMNMVDPERPLTVVDVDAAAIVRSVALPGPSHHAAVSPADGRSIRLR